MMEYKMVNLDSYNIHFIKTDKFKTIDVRVVFLDKFKKEDITKRNMLLDNLIYSTKNYPTRRYLSIKCQELYSAAISVSNNRIGNYLMSRINLSLLNPKYTEDSMLEESLDLLKEIIFNPNVVDNQFNKDNFEIVKQELINELESVNEQPRLKTVIRTLENMSKHSPYRYHGYCYKDDLEKINVDNLYEYYLEFLKSNTIEIFVVGDFDMNVMEKLIKDKFQINIVKKKVKDIIVEHDMIRKRLRKVIEESDNLQSNLCVGLKLSGLTEFESKYVCNIYNLLLGGISDSFLMKNVRENESIAYYIKSSLSKMDNLILINSGITSNNFDKTVKLIKKTLVQLANGEFSDEDIKKCQLEYISSIDYAGISSSNLIDLKMFNYLKLADDIETRKEKIMKVTKEDLKEFSKKVSLDTVYLLKGE